MKRTETQNNAHWLYCERLAEALNDAGWDMKRVFESKLRKRLGGLLDTWRVRSTINNYYNDCADELEAVMDACRDVDVPWNKDLVHRLLWLPVQTALYPDKTSTTQLERMEMVNVFEVLNRHLSEKFGVSVEWPHE